MAQYSIFISYSKKDWDFLQELTEQLATFDLDLKPWSDRDIATGNSWHRDIHTAMKHADAAVLLVSPSFLATKYVCNVEIPFLMEEANAGNLVLAPLFLRPSNVALRDFPEILSPRTGENGAKITDFQGLNRPDRPISGLLNAERDTLWVSCAEKLWKRVQEHCKHRHHAQAKERSNKTVTVELALKGQQVHRQYSVPGGDPIRGRPGRVDFERLRALRKTRNDLELGERLFGVLFGDEKQVASLVPSLLGKGTPVAHMGVRLQVFTDSAELQDLPWACCAWRQHFLADQQWTFELVTRAGRQAEVELDTPCAAVMIGCELAGSELGLEQHFKSFEGVLDRSWDHPPRIDAKWLQRAQDIAEDRDIAPQLVYICAHAREGKPGEVEIALAGPSGKPEYLPVKRLLSQMLGGKPSIVVLNTFGPAPLVEATSDADATLHFRHLRPSQDAGAWATTFWSRVLDGEASPALAFHELGVAARRIGAIRTHYATFETRISDRTPKVDRARMKLDRRVQREAVMTFLRDLVRGPERKVTSAIAYGSTGNLVELFAVQVTATIRQQASDIAQLNRHRLSFPNPRRALDVEDFDEVMREYLRLQPEQPLFEGFEAKARRGVRAAPVHFIVWDCTGRDKAPSGPDLATWLRYSSEYLSAGVRGSSRILSYVAITLRNERHRDLVKLLEGQSRSLSQNHFRLEVMQPLEKITPKDLRDFLRSDANTSCPLSMSDEIAERLCHEAGGEFERIIEQLERAERANLWPELLATLPEPDSDPYPEDF